jgi:hypothetical protein
MRSRWILLTSALLLTCGSGEPCRAQSTSVWTCAAFSSDGALATGTIKQGDLETKLSEPGAAATTTHIAFDQSTGCEQAFSRDGKWMATVVATDQLKVMIFDRKSGSRYIIAFPLRGGNLIVGSAIPREAPHT